MALTDDEARAWIRQFTPESPLKLVCFPHAGGAATFVGDADPVTTLDDASAWLEHSTAEVDLQIFPGGHFYLDSQVDAVAEETRRRLAGRVHGTAAMGRG